MLADLAAVEEVDLFFVALLSFDELMPDENTSLIGAVMASVHAAFHEPDTRSYRIVQGSVWALIVFSIILLIVEAVLPDGSSATAIVGQADRILLAIFAVEIYQRVIRLLDLETDVGRLLDPRPLHPFELAAERME